MNGNNNRARRGKFVRKGKNNNNYKGRQITLSGVSQMERQYEILNNAKIPRNLGGNSPFPAYMIRKLTYMFPSMVMSGATPFLLREFRVNSAFDPDPLVSTGVVAGFASLATIYGQYRVENFRVRLEVSSNEPALSQVVGLVFKDEQPSTVITTYRDAQDALEVAPSTGPQILGQTGGTSVWRSPWYKIKPGTISGNQLEYMSDNAFSALSNANPSQIVWMALLSIGPTSGGTLPNGVIVNLFMEFTTRFYGLKDKLDTTLYEDLQSRRERKSSVKLTKQRI